MKVIKTVIADDQPLFIEGLRSIFTEKASEIDILACHSDGKDLLKDQSLHRADLLILDLNLPGSTGHPEKDGRIRTLACSHACYLHSQ